MQVMRRIRALLSELLAVLPEGRSPVLRYWNGRLESTVAKAFPDKDDVLDGSTEDREGLGSSQQASHAAPGPVNAASFRNVYCSGTHALLLTTQINDLSVFTSS
jgi:hypothetical protein